MEERYFIMLIMEGNQYLIIGMLRRILNNEDIKF